MRATTRGSLAHVCGAICLVRSRLKTRSIFEIPTCSFCLLLSHTKAWLPKSSLLTFSPFQCCVLRQIMRRRRRYYVPSPYLGCFWRKSWNDWKNNLHFQWYKILLSRFVAFWSILTETVVVFSVHVLSGMIWEKSLDGAY
jgi:hypothetical protein